jgi:hypothetical protein
VVAEIMLDRAEAMNSVNPELAGADFYRSFTIYL